MKGQVKIQEMAFVLIAIAVFFGLVALLYFSVRLNQLEGSALVFKDDAARALLRSLPSAPELQWAACTSCIDLDKVIVFKEQGNSSRYAQVWELDYLAIERMYPIPVLGECVLGNYPACSTLTLLNTSRPDRAPTRAFVSLCRWDADTSNEICELGVLLASGGSV
ncbi:hypothetical protein HYZ97_02930 [Candidatus Pacearchaeota archaeon]|nr:hypothetical protein [Candidatus Pacearchaeota archaeon]